MRAEDPTALSRCTAVAGLSLGEYSALVHAGAISFEDAVRVVGARARAMQASVDASRMLISNLALSVFTPTVVVSCICSAGCFSSLTCVDMLLQAAGKASVGTMATVVNVDDAVLEKACADASRTTGEPVRVQFTHLRNLAVACGRCATVPFHFRSFNIDGHDSLCWCRMLE